ncbi:MAG: glycosyltransferase family 61 protein [Sulfitobacter sp.]
MRNNIDLSLDPDELFLNPWREEGLRLLDDPEFIWRETETTVIDGFAVSAHAEINAKIRAFVGHTKKHKRFSKPIEINSVPVVLENASFRKSHVLANEKLVLSGASATRLINGYRWENEGSEIDPSKKLDTYFSQCSAGNEGRKLSIETTFIEPDLDFAIECRNTFNYFHFLTETLCQLSVLDGVGFRGKVFFHFPNQEEKHRGFADAFVAALFPEFEGRVFFERAPKAYDIILSAFDMTGGISQMPKAATKGIMRLAPEGTSITSMDFRAVLAMNSVSTALINLRKRALRAIEAHDFSYLPKRVFVGRGDDQSRNRPLDGQQLLLDQLAPMEFDYVVFEELAPLEQIALMAQAEVMVSHHGAGFANMLFAGSDTYVIELGTLQTAQHRWADFWPLAHASKCKYLTFFADFSAEDPLSEPNFSSDGIVPTALSPAAISQITTFIAGILGNAPDLQNVKNLTILARRMFRAGAIGPTIELLDRHQDIVLSNGALCLLRADCHKAWDQPKSELVALGQAYEADPMRWQTLVRLIWCANRCERPEVIQWSVAQLAAEFPDRHDAFVANHDWVRFVV